MATNDIPIVPIFDPNRGWRPWARSEIYTGSGTGVYVPNVDDLVWDWLTGVWRVVEVDITTGLSRLEKHTPIKDPGENGDLDLLLGAGPGYQSESYRCFIDTSVIPHTLALDARLHYYGTTLSYVKVFLGTDISDESKVISAMYDHGGTLLGENIPLELVKQSTPDPLLYAALTPNPVLSNDNYAVKTAMVGYTRQQLPDNEVVTVVAYDDANVARSQAKLLIVNSTFTRTTDASKRYIRSIHLESPFMAENNDRLLKFPINLPVAQLDARGVITYSDGSKSKPQPIDGVKWKLFGLSNFIPTIIGQKIPLVLNYALSPEEYVYGASAGLTRSLNEPYQATTDNHKGAYSIKLFCYPVWVDAVTGYTLRWFLYNLDRDTVYPVTALVQIAANSRAFNPTEYGTTQNLTVAVDMNKVDPRYNTGYRHAQTVAVSLLAPGDEDTTNWTIGFTPGREPYGVGVRAEWEFVNANLSRLNLSSGQTNVEAWLDRVYYDTEPLFNVGTEIRAPAPNYFRLVYGTTEVEYPVSQWDATLDLNGSLTEGGVVFVKWIKRTANTDLQLGISGFVVHQKTA